MAIKQKRSLVTGSIPTTASLAIGELAMNIPDGRIFFRKSGSGSDTVQSAITTGAQNSGSVVISGSLSLYASTGSVLDISGDIFEISGDIMEFTGSLRVTGSALITGSLSVTNGITGSLLGTSSFATSASFAVSASWAPGGSSGLSNFISTGSVTASVNVSSTNAFNVVSASNTLIQVTPNRTLLVGDATQIPNETAWKSPGVFGSGSANKVLAGYLASTTNGATIGANNSNFSSWADLNIAGTNLIFRSAETEYMRLASTGNFGIGVTSPGAKLHVGGAVSASAFTGSLLGTATTASYVLQAVSASFATSASQAVSSSWAGNADLLDGAHLSILATTGSNTFIGNQTITGSVNITGSGLNLTRNVSSTQATITVTNTTAGGSSAAQVNVVSSNGTGQIQKRSSSTTTYKILTPNNFVLYNDTAGDIAILNDAAGNIKMATGGGSTSQIFLSSSGQVGIGTVAPSNTLHVVGTSLLNGNVTLGDGVYFDDLNNRLGIGVSSPTQVLDVAAQFAVAKFTSTTGTNSAFFQYVNTGGNFFLGTEDSTSATFGATAYAGVVYHSAREIEFFPAATRRMALKTTGQMQLYSYTSTSSFPGTVAAVLAVDSSGNVITTAASGSAGGGGGGTPGGANTTIQFNDSNAFSGSGNFTFTKATNTVKIQGSGSVLLHITGSQGDLFRVIDSGSAASTILATISSGSRNVFTFTTSSLIVTGSVLANIETDAIHYGRIVVTPSTNQNNYSPTGWNDADPAKSTTINITAGASIKITGLAGGAAGRMAILKNTSTDRLIILEDESSSSTAANRFDFRNPIFLLPNGSATLLYDGVDSRWQPIATSGGIGFGAFFDVFEDFLGTPTTFNNTTAAVGRFAGAGSGTGAQGQATTTLVNTTEKPLGVYEITTGTTSTGKSILGTNQTAYVLPTYGQAMFLARIAVSALSDGTNTYQIYAGFHDAYAGTNVTDGVYWVYNQGASTAWQGATAAGGTRTTTGAAGPTVDTTFIWLGIYINPTWTRATYFYSQDSITWTIAGEQTTNLPSSAQTTAFGVMINKTVGTTARSCYVDFLAYRYDITRG